MKNSLPVVVILVFLASCSVVLELSHAQTTAPAPTGAAQVGTPQQAAPQTQPPGRDPTTRLGKVGEVLLVFLVLSVVFEVALTPIFNWRVFLKNFEGRGVKTPVIVGLAFVVFWRYDLDVVKDLLVALGYEPPQTVGGQILTALLIAGGSDGVLRIFTRLGIRNPTERKEKAEESRRGEQTAADRRPQERPNGQSG